MNTNYDAVVRNNLIKTQHTAINSNKYMIVVGSDRVAIPFGLPFFPMLEGAS